MWILFVVLSLIAGLSVLGYEMFADTTGWKNLSVELHLVVFLLPALAALTLILLCILAAKTGLRWTSVAGLVVFIGAVQTALAIHDSRGRATLWFLPLVVIGLCGVALGWRNYSIAGPAIEWVQRAAPYAAAFGLVAIGATLGVQKLERRRIDEYLALHRAEAARNDATLRGMARAAWLLEREFHMGEISESEFIRTGVYRRGRGFGDFRWDDGRQRLVLTYVLFGEFYGLRDKLLPQAARVLQSKTLGHGGFDLQGGTLHCQPPLDCTVTWEFDVDQLHDGQSLNKSVNSIEVVIYQEIFPRGQ